MGAQTEGLEAGQGLLARSGGLTLGFHPQSAAMIDTSIGRADSGGQRRTASPPPEDLQKAPFLGVGLLAFPKEWRPRMLRFCPHKPGPCKKLLEVYEAI